MALEKLFQYIEDHQELYIKHLAEVVSIESVSAWPDHRVDVAKAINYINCTLLKLCASTELVNPGMQIIQEGSCIPLPPVILAHLGSDPSKKTVLIYGHLDVQPAHKSDGWNTEPFVLTEIDGKMFGRGTSDGKGPVLCWLNVIESYQALGIPLPINIKFCLEGMGGSGSHGLHNILATNKFSFLSDIDYVCSNWLGDKKPCRNYGHCGTCNFVLEVQCAQKDVDSETRGGICEAFPDICYLMGQLTDVEGNILIPGIKEKMASLNELEKDYYDADDFDVDKFQQNLRLMKLTEAMEQRVLIHQWQYPSLSIHGIDGSINGDGCKTLIPMRVRGEFSISLVPNMTPSAVEYAVTSYIEKLQRERGSPNQVKVILEHGAKPWVANPQHRHFLAGRKAMKGVFGTEPDLKKEGGSIPVTQTFLETTGKNVILLPVGAGDAGPNSENEKLTRHNYVEGMKVLAAFFMEVAALE